MIHAFLFLTDFKSQKHEGGHGDKFKEKMREINIITGLNITVYH